MGITEGVGKTIRMDPITAEMIKARYESVCVELDLNGLLPPHILVWGRKQSIEYEGLYHIYLMCGKYVHKKEGCPMGTRPQDED